MQTFFPVYPSDTKMINSKIGIKIIQDKALYFNADGPIYQHDKGDYQSFRYITSQMIELKTVRQTEIISFFKVSKESVIRWCKIYRQKGGKGFFGTKKNEKRGNVLTKEVLPEIQGYLNQGKSVKEIGEELSIKPDTIQKGIQTGRLTRLVIAVPPVQAEKTQSERSRQDSVATLGVGCTNEIGRIEAALKKKVALPKFENNVDVPKAGVLLAVPALLSNGLLSHNNVFAFDEGYYSLSSIFLTLAFSSLLRIKSIEKISDEPPGELGKLIGLDRIPEIKTLRNKIAELGQQDQGKMWIGELSRQWMQMYPNLAGVMYIDGHTDVYYGKTNKLPRHYVSRMRLAMRATADYWVCDKLGQPFFSINKSISGSMIDVIKQEIIPVLENDIPNQPDQSALNNDPRLHKFMIVYDREGYSPDFMIDLWEKRVACCTYNKYTQDPWPETEFAEYEIETQNGEKEKVQLAERAVLLEGNETENLPVAMQVVEVEETGQGIQVKITNKRTKKKRQIWVREVRKLRDDGNQTSILTTNYKLPIVLIGMYMFARWCQENFFKYMVHNFGLDMIISNFFTDISDTEQMVNPAYRELEKKIRALNTKLKHRESKLGALHYDNEINSKEFNGLTEKKAKLQEDVAIYRCQLEEHKAMRQTTPPKINYADLPEEEKFKGVYNQRKQVVDTIKLIAGRSEIALATIIKKHMSKPEEARALMEQFYKTNADIKVDNQNKIIQIKLHHQATRHEDMILSQLCEYMNETETLFPATNLMLQYCLV